MIWLFWFRAAESWWLTVALGLVAGGIVGNLYDRLGLWWHEDYPVEWQTVAFAIGFFGKSTRSGNGRISISPIRCWWSGRACCCINRSFQRSIHIMKKPRWRNRIRHNLRKAAGNSTMNDFSGQLHPDNWTEHHDGRLLALVEIAIAAGEHTLKYFGSGELKVDAKSDDSPVTVADREAEQLVRQRLSPSRFPSDTVQGEEFDEKTGDSRYRWVVDPIDGTKSFVCGVPIYSTLLALELDGEPLAGVIFIPALNEIVVAANSLGCWHRKAPSPNWRRAQVSSKTDLSEAVFVNSQVDSFDHRGASKQYKALEKACWISRTWGDGYGYLMVATGRADVMIDPICNAWDVAAILPVDGGIRRPIHRLERQRDGARRRWRGHQRQAARPKC